VRDPQSATRLPRPNWLGCTGVNRIFFKLDLKIFEEPENNGLVELGNENLRSSQVAPRQSWRLILIFLIATYFLAPNREFFLGFH
jgi:hypothetical protein